MARTKATLAGGVRVTDCIGLGVVTKVFPRERIDEVLDKSGATSRRQRLMPAHVAVYYVIGMALFMQVSYREVFRCMTEGLSWLGILPADGATPTKGAITAARQRLGVEPLRLLYEQTVQPIATTRTPGAWYRSWRLVSVDGSTLDLADQKEIADEFGRPGASRGESAFPKLRLVSLVENGTHVLFGAAYGAYHVSENELALLSIRSLRPGMLCLADRGFASFALFKAAAATGADLHWRARANAILPMRERFADGSYLSRIYASAKDRRHDRNGIAVRVIEYRLEVPGAEPLYRLITTILDPATAPARELAAVYHDRWEIETAFDELKTHLRGAQIVLRSKTPELVKQEFYGLLLAHFAVRGLMHEAALAAKLDPDRLSFVHAIRVIRRKLPSYHAFSPSGPQAPASGSAPRAP
jgi:hypothetical protein